MYTHRKRINQNMIDLFMTKVKELVTNMRCLNAGKTALVSKMAWRGKGLWKEKKEAKEMTAKTKPGAGRAMGLA